MNRTPRGRGEMGNEQIERLRNEVSALMEEPEFKEMSEAFKHALAQRLGIKPFTEGGLMVHGNAPINLNDLIREHNIRDLNDIKRYDDDDPYCYGNIYSYSFW